MPSISAKEFLNCTLRSELVSEELLRGELKQLKESDPKSLSSAHALAKHLVSRRLITHWQAGSLLKGRYKGFDLGNYRLLDQLGAGGMSMVYLGEHKRMQREVALKILPKSKVNNKAYLDRFLVEARAAAALSHPNIVRAYDFDSEGDTHFLVMERLRGQDLAELVKSAHPVPIDDVVRYISQAATGLQHAHDEGLVHRDIKPANLMVTEQGQVKVLDMGLARLAQTAEDSSITKDGPQGVMGTADYLSPEQAINSHDVDHRADIYSLGCTLYFALTGQPPFPDGNIAQKIAQHQTRDPEPVGNLRSDCPRELAELCSQMMLKDPDRRTKTMQEVVERLNSVVAVNLHNAVQEMDLAGAQSMANTAPDGLEGLVLEPAASSPTKRRPRRNKRSTPIWMWLIMFGLLAAAGWLAIKIKEQGGLF